MGHDERDEYMIGFERDGLIGGSYGHVTNESDGSSLALDSELRMYLLDLSDAVWDDITVSGIELDMILFSASVPFTILLCLDTDVFKDDSKHFIRYMNKRCRRWCIEHKMPVICGIELRVEVVDISDIVDNGKLFDIEKNEKFHALADGSKLIESYMTINEEVVADGNAEHNPFAKKWKEERQALKDFLCKYGKLMTSMENGKTYKVYYDETLSRLIGHNYCVCLQYDAVKMEPKSTIYIRALDKFTERMFSANFDTRGKDNMQGTTDDIVSGTQQM